MHALGACDSGFESRRPERSESEQDDRSSCVRIRGAQITSVAITPCASRNSNGGSNPVMNVYYRWGGENSSDSGAYSLTGTTPASLSATAFSASLIKSSTSTLEIGAVYASGSKGVRLSQISATLTYTELSAPTSLGATALIAHLVTLQWNDNTSIEVGYAIERSTDGVNFVEIGRTTAQNITGSYLDTTVNPVTSYFYRVRAFNAGGVVRIFEPRACDDAGHAARGPKWARCGCDGIISGRIILER